MSPRHVRRGLVGLFSVGSVLVLTAGAAWTCASLASVDVTPNVVRPGQEVAWKGTFFIKDEPVTLRWNTLDGPVLSVATPPSPDNGLHGTGASSTGRSPSRPAPGRGRTW